ncbi:polysaccharide deacetylase family protein [Streptomyces roseoverticillatus]|uniref:polysaccharide deacetylase family protein n=1 Tax=Streptomyces roseoverticillatus TaxID=66429 RepID=UPI001F16CEEF|nr:polysaccharide deacetylase family protein [Streptomyces roseoverticillatus]MCF3101343.1 polysaccharide deacetylase family protein [Streptomyces roseoverticillatus]
MPDTSPVLHTLRVRPPLVAALASLLLTLCPLPASASDARPAPAVPRDYDRTRCGNDSGRVLLTFDDWSYDRVERAAEAGAYLRGRGIRAAFFLINEQASQHPEVARTLRRQGHWVGNHTWSHPHLTGLSEEAARKEISEGVKSSLFRPPYGDFGPRETRIAASLGARVCTWTVDTLDWEGGDGRFPDVATLRARVRNAPAADKRGGVILGHLFSSFPDAVPGIVDDLRAQGYSLCRNTGRTTPVIRDPLRC